jgi:hypothetical protein
MTNLDYQIKVLLDLKTGTTHKNATQPRIAVKANSRGEKGEFFVVSLMPLTKGPKVVFGKPIKFTIWNTGQRSEVFNRLKNDLATSTPVLDADKNVVLSDTTVYLSGSLVKEDCGFYYTMTDSDGKPLVDSKGVPQQRNYVQVFIFDFEQGEVGTGDIIIANEVNRAKKTEVMNAE